MVSITITEKGGKPQTRQFDQPEITVGRVQGNDIVLPKSNISKRHARIVENDGTLVVIDTKSTNGTYVNGKRIGGPQDLEPGDKVYVGDFTLEVVVLADEHPAAPESSSRSQRQQALTQDFASAELEADQNAQASGAWASQEIGLSDEGEVGQDEAGGQDESQGEGDYSAGGPSYEDPKDPPLAEPPAWQQKWDAPAPEPAPAKRPTQERAAAPRATGSAAARPTGGAKVATVELQAALSHQAHSSMAPGHEGETPGSISLPEEQSYLVELVHGRLREAIDYRQMALGDQETVRVRITDTVHGIVSAMSSGGELPEDLTPQLLVDCVLGEVLGMGPLEDLLADPSVTEILVNNARQIYVERNGRLEACDMVFSCDLAVVGVIERIVAPLGRRIDINSPMVDARLKDGSRVNAVIAPLSVKGPTLTIRKFAREPLQVDDLVAGSTLSADMAEFLETCVKARKNILVSGGTGSGKTTLLNVLSSFISPNERIITIEDAAELKLEQGHVVTLESRPATIDGPADVSIRDLVRNALRMRPDRIIVGECRGGEALDMLQAMNTGHDGSLTTVHANGPREALSRMETLVLMAGMELPAKAIREQVAGAIDIVVQQARLSDGTRRITHIAEITGMEGDVISMHNLFTYEQSGVTADGRIQGRFRASGVIPKFYEGLRQMGIKVNLGLFRNN